MSESDKKEVHTERIFITAEMSRRWLRMNIENNRPVNNDRVNQYARDMKAGNWKENGDTIKFTEDGQLIDGQHRLNACMQAGVGFWSLVAYGVKKDAFVTIDRNQSRTTAQVLHLKTGIGDYNNVAAVIAWLWRFRDGIMMATRQPTSIEAEEILEKHQQINDSVCAARRVRLKFHAGPMSAIAICHYLFTRQDATLAEAFFDALATGANLREVDPVYQLRQRIITAQTSTAKKLTTYELIALYFKAWLAEKEQRTMHQLRWNVNEPFPNIGPIDSAKVRPDKVKDRASKKSAAAAAASTSPEPSSNKSKLDQLIEKHGGLDMRSN